MGNIEWLKNSGFIALYAILWGAMEVEIEGEKGGWAKNLPTKKFLGSHFTIYHLLMNLIVILTIIFVMWVEEADFWETLFYISAWFLIEDFSWFMINPGFGIKKYNKKDIWWHGKQPWILGMPLHNYVAIGVMALCAGVSTNNDLWYSFAMLLGITLSIGLTRMCIKW